MTKVSHVVVWGDDHAPVAEVRDYGKRGWRWHCVLDGEGLEGYTSAAAAMRQLADHLERAH